VAGLWDGAVADGAFQDARSFWAHPVEIDGDPPEDYHPATRDLSPGACALCHPRQYEEWRGSLHAQAISPGLLGQLGTLSLREQRSCLGCHLPPAERQATWESRALEARTEIHGVDCASCHVRDQRRLGPRERPATPHGPVAGAEFFRDSSFCAPCHQFGAEAIVVNGKPLENTYEEWSRSRYASEGTTCQSCHMPGGSHRFAGVHDPGMTARALRVTATRSRAGVEVDVSNDGAGHALPTYSVPRIRISVDAPAGGAGPGLDYAIERRMDWDARRGWRELADTRLMPGQRVRLEHPLPAAAPAEVSVRVEPDADYFERVYPTLLEDLAEDASREELDLLQAARRRAGDSPYVLFRAACGAWEGEAAPCLLTGTPGVAPQALDAGGTPLRTPGRAPAQVVTLRAGDPQGSDDHSVGPETDRGPRPREH
jgi:hypothetical protein